MNREEAVAVKRGGMDYNFDSKVNFHLRLHIKCVIVSSGGSLFDCVIGV